MALNYDNMRSLAERLLTENGTPAVLSRVDSTAYDPISDTDTLSVTDYPVDVVLTKVRSDNDRQDLEMMNLTYLVGDMTKILISGSQFPAGFIPMDQDTVVVAGTTWTLVGVNPVRPDGSNVLFICYAKRGQT